MEGNGPRLANAYCRTAQQDSLGGEGGRLIEQWAQIQYSNPATRLEPCEGA